MSDVQHAECRLEVLWKHLAVPDYLSSLFLSVTPSNVLHRDVALSLIFCISLSFCSGCRVLLRMLYGRKIRLRLLRSSSKSVCFHLSTTQPRDYRMFKCHTRGGDYIVAFTCCIACNTLCSSMLNILVLFR